MLTSRRRRKSRRRGQLDDHENTRTARYCHNLVMMVMILMKYDEI